MEIVIELSCSEKRDENGTLLQGGNGNVHIGPLGENRRGAWSKNAVHSSFFSDPANVLYASLPQDIPGYHVSVDLRAKKVKVFDPLYGTAKGEDFANRALASRAKAKITFERPKVYDGLADSELWQWLKWCYRAVRGDNARLVKGEFPTAVAERVEKEREWDLAYDPGFSGARQLPYEKEPAVASLVSAGK